jgi:glycosyltransferase involved in cell wall biosynthesis
MNILIINHYAGSSIHGMEYRPYYLAKEWMRLGHVVTIVAASFSHLHTKSPEVKEILTHELIDGINYIWLKTPRYVGNGGARVLNMLCFAWKLINMQHSILNLSQPNVVIASSPHPFIIYGAKMIAQSTRAKLIFEVRDLWPLTLIELGGIPYWHPFIIFMQMIENYAYRVADKVVSLLPKADDYMKVHGMVKEKYTYIPNGINVEEWQLDNVFVSELHKSTLDKLKSDGHFIIGYTGAHGLANGLNYLVDSAKLLSNEKIAVVFIGKGPEKQNLKNLAARYGLNNIFFLPPVIKSEIPNILSYIDTLYIGLLREPLFRFGVSPNKLMDYMMASKPVIYAIEAGNDLIAESGCGISIPPENSKAIADAVRLIMGMNHKERFEMGKKGKSYVLQYHDYRVLANKFCELF